MKRIALLSVILLSPNIMFAINGPQTDIADGRHYTTLNQITPKNVKHLKKVWEFKTGDVSVKTKDSAQTAFEATPIFFDNKLILCTGYNRVIALNPKTGKQLWAFDPHLDKIHKKLGSAEGYLICRGVAHWTKPNATGMCSKRIFSLIQDGRLVALDAETGKPCPTFGANGEINTKKNVMRKLIPDEMKNMSKEELKAMGFPDVWVNDIIPNLEQIVYSHTSAPAVIDNLVIAGSAIADVVWMRHMPKGSVQAFDAETGKLVWSWNAIPEELSDKIGSANVWGNITVDRENHTVFVGTGSPNSDYYGGHRLDPMPYADALVALDSRTGKPKWHFQVVHHDIYDYDIPSQAAVGNIRRDGKLKPAVMLGTKMGFVYAFDRDTGESLFPIEEQPVSAAMLPGDRASATQPVPVLPKPLVGLPPLTEKDMWGLVYFDKLWCRHEFNKSHYTGIFTPATTYGSVHFPMTGGGIIWGGVSYSPDAGLLIANYSRIAQIVKMKKLKVPDSLKDWVIPYMRDYKRFLSPLGVPCNAPPWGGLVAIDMQTGQVRWKHPFGAVKTRWFLKSFERWGSPNVGGSLLTKSGLIFIGASLDFKFHAFNLWNGQEIWTADLPATGNATPMTYMYDGKQYVVICAGGSMGVEPHMLGDSVVAYALDDNKTESEK